MGFTVVLCAQSSRSHTLQDRMMGWYWVTGNPFFPWTFKRQIMKDNEIYIAWGETWKLLPQAGCKKLQPPFWMVIWTRQSVLNIWPQWFERFFSALFSVMPSLVNTWQLACLWDNNKKCQPCFQTLFDLVMLYSFTTGSTCCWSYESFTWKSRSWIFMPKRSRTLV